MVDLLPVQLEFWQWDERVARRHEGRLRNAEKNADVLRLLFVGVLLSRQLKTRLGQGRGRV